MTKYIRSTRTSLKIALVLAAAAIAPVTIAATTNATTSATVISPIQIVAAANLSFGSFSPSAAPGTVTIDTDGARAVGGGVVAVGGTPSAAKFDVTGNASSTYTITLTPGTLSNGTDNMSFTTLSALTAATGTTGNVATGTLSGAGTESIFVGGELAVAANQPGGTYTGIVTADVNYN